MPQANSTFTLSGTISDGTAPNGIVLAGNPGSNLMLDAVNTYSGDTTISSGTLVVGVSNAIPSGAGKGNVTVANGAALNLYRNLVSLNGLFGAGTVGSIQGGSLTLGNNNANSTFSGVLTNVALSKTGSGVVVLTGSNSYANGIMVSAGTLQIGRGGNTGSISGAVIDNGTLAVSPRSV